MKLIRLSAVLIVLLTLIGSAQAQGWSPIKLNTGGKDLNTVYFLDSKRGWVGGDGGFLKSHRGRRPDAGYRSMLARRPPSTTSTFATKKRVSYWQEMRSL